MCANPTESKLAQWLKGGSFAVEVIDVCAAAAAAAAAEE